jgi:arylsulfatase A-like enzyme
MDKRLLACVAVLFMVALTGCSDQLGSGEALVPEARNIVLVLTDDVGYADFYENEAGPMTHISELKKTGISFSRAYSSSRLCSPSRLGLYSGREPARIGWFFNPILTEHIPLGIEIIAERFKKAGFSTAFVGKWHLGQTIQFSPLDQGFDYFYGLLHGSHDYWRSGESASRRYGMLWENRTQVKAPDQLTRVFFQKAADVIQGWDQNGKHLLVLATTAAHSPMEPTPQGLARVPDSVPEPRAHYLGHVVDIDQGVGLLLKTLSKQGLYDKTIVIVTNDNGGDTRMKSVLIQDGPNGDARKVGGPVADNDGLRGGKGDLFDGGIRVPMVIEGPGIPENRSINKPVSHMDVFPTLLDVFGIPKTGLSFDGESFSHCLLNPDNCPVGRNKPMYYLNPGIESFKSRSYRDGWAAMIDWPWKLLVDKYDDEVKRRLYNLEKDPGERNVLSDENPEILSRLESNLDSYLKNKVDWEAASSRQLRRKHRKWWRANVKDN